jgi:DNA-binding NarL/FixJ family response regulator
MNKVTVVLADDHAVVRAGIRNALEGLPNLEMVGEVGDGPELFATLALTQPDCLLIDLTMPDFEPLSAIHRIRALYPDLKILVVSAYDDNVYVQELLSAGVDGYHLKDQPLNDLRLAVQRILAGERWISSRLLEKLVSNTGARPASPNLTRRQQEILRLLQQGLDNQTIARQIGLSVKTVENHLTRLYRQLGVQSRLEAVNYLMQHPEVLGLSGPLTVAETETLPQDCVAVLVVDDNARYRRQLRRMVGKACPQATIYEAEDTTEALNLTERITPQLVLVDVVLGDEDGIRCTRRIKAHSPSSRIVLISAYPDREFHRLGLEAGAVAFLDKKDLDAATLRQVVEDVIA